MDDVLAWAVLILVMGGLVWFAFWNEPHWVSKDGRRFTCRVSELDPHTGVPGRWRERNAAIDEDGYLRLGGKPSIRSMTRGDAAVNAESGPPVRVLGRADDTRRFAVFVLDGTPVRSLRLPRRSRAVPLLDAAAAGHP